MTEPNSPNDPVRALVAPQDPRAGWGLPAFGQIPTYKTIDDSVSRVLAPNPGRMSLDGTNTYVVGRPGSGDAAIVDPGPPDPEHLARVERALADRKAECRLILVTHHHGDHAEAALPWAERFGVQVAATSPDVVGPKGLQIKPGVQLSIGDMDVQAVPTPGHCWDHLSYQLDTGVVLTGDHILGRGTTVVGRDRQDLPSYLDSLRKVLDLAPSAMLPGHGPEMTVDPAAVINFYLDHRAYREQQILLCLTDGPADPPTLVRRIYWDVDEGLWRPAESSTRAALQKLEDEGRVRVDGDIWSLSA